MPIEYAVLPDKRIVVTRCYGVLADAEVFSYQRQVWSRPDVAGFNELLDTRSVTEIAAPHPANPRLAELATESAAMDARSQPARIAILAPGDLAYGMARMYQTQRQMEPRSTKEVGVFKTLGEVWEFLQMASFDLEKLTYQPVLVACEGS